MLYTMEYEQKYQLKAQKYKIKYAQLKAKFQLGGSPEFDLMDVIELYDKTFNLYVLYRFRYDNTISLIEGLPKFSDKVFQNKNRVKKSYNSYYISDLLTQQDPSVLATKKKEMIFTLRQDTTKLIRDVVLPNNESRAKVQVYLDFIDEHQKTEQDKSVKDDLDELHNKCMQINGLISPGEVLLSEPDERYLVGLNIIRHDTNKILKK